MKHVDVLMVTVLPILGACSTRVDLTPEDTATVSQAASSTTSQVVTGYKHSPSVSRFKLGDGEYSEFLAIGQRHVGSKGAILVTPTGATLAVANADSDVDAVGPLSTNPEVHTAAVLSYFLAAGLPKAQVNASHITTLMAEKANAMDPTATLRRLVGYTTVIDRHIGGVRVSGSYAWARLNANGDAMAEEVYWPAVPVTVVNGASQLQATLANAAQKQALLDKVPSRWASADTEREVVIRHSPQFQPNFESYAAIEFRSPSQSAPAWYDSNGKELRFAFETAPPSPATRTR